MPLLAYYALWINGESGPAPRARGNCRHSLFEVAAEFRLQRKDARDFFKRNAALENGDILAGKKSKQNMSDHSSAYY